MSKGTAPDYVTAYRLAQRVKAGETVSFDDVHALSTGALQYFHWDVGGLEETEKGYRRRRRSNAPTPLKYRHEIPPFGAARAYDPADEGETYVVIDHGPGYAVVEYGNHPDPAPGWMEDAGEELQRVVELASTHLPPGVPATTWVPGVGTLQRDPDGTVWGWAERSPDV